MTARLFSILRRKVGLVDLIAPAQAPSTGVVQYRLKMDSTPTGSFSTNVMTVPRTGYVDPSVAGPQHVIQPGDNVRVIFKPSNFGLSDTAYFWVKLVYIDAANAEMVSPAPGAATLVLPPYSGPVMSGFTATAPSSAAQIDLPRVMENFRIFNSESSTALAIAFQEGGPEVTVPAGKEISSFDGNVSSIWIHGVGGTAQFSASFTYAFPR